MVEVNGAHKHGRYEEIWLNGMHPMPNVESFATQDGRPVGWTPLITYPYDTHMDNKGNHL